MNAVQKCCAERLEEVMDQDKVAEVYVVNEMQQNPEGVSPKGSHSIRRHSEAMQKLTNVFLAKLRV